MCGSIRGREFLLLRPGRTRANEDVCTARPRVMAICSNHSVVPGDGHTDAEMVICGRIRGGEFLLLRPSRPRANEDVHAARDRAMASCSNHDIVPRDGHTAAEPVICGSIRGREFLLLRPGRPRANEDVRATAITPSVIIAIRPNHGVVPGDGHAAAETVIVRRIRGREFLLLRPGRPRANEDVCATRVRVIARCPNQGVVPRDGHAGAESGTFGRIRGREFLLLRPGRTRANEDVRAARVRVMARCSNHGVVPGDGHTFAEMVICGRIREFLLLRPGRPRANENVRAARPTTPSVIIAICSNHGVVPRDGHTDAEIVNCGRIRGREFLLRYCPIDKRREQQQRPHCLRKDHGRLPRRLALQL